MLTQITMIPNAHALTYAGTKHNETANERTAGCACAGWMYRMITKLRANMHYVCDACRAESHLITHQEGISLFR